MKQIGALLFFVLLIPTFASASCDDAYHSCRKQCESITSLINADNKTPASIIDTDFLNNCKDSCRRGRRFCNIEAHPENAYQAFINRCESNCPIIVTSMGSQSTLSNTNAKATCKEACENGSRLVLKIK
jgi:hypothetical protein